MYFCSFEGWLYQFDSYAVSPSDAIRSVAEVAMKHIIAGQSNAQRMQDTFQIKVLKSKFEIDYE